MSWKIYFIFLFRKIFKLKVVVFSVFSYEVWGIEHISKVILLCRNKWIFLYISAVLILSFETSSSGIKSSRYETKSIVKISNRIIKQI